MFVSSAHLRMPLPISFSELFMWIRNNRGPNAAPWGTALITGLQLDNLIPILLPQISVFYQLTISNLIYDPFLHTMKFNFNQ